LQGWFSTIFFVLSEMDKLLSHYRKNRALSTLVENRTIYTCSNAELNLFETHQAAEKVQLHFDYPVIAIMLTGKKVMHLTNQEPFDFYPSESVVMPANEPMIIDFPLATLNEPTQCLALGIDKYTVSEAVGLYNQEVSIDGESTNWTLDKDSTHLTNNGDLSYLIQRIFYTFVNTHNTSKDVLISLMSKELVVRLLQTKARKWFLGEQQDQVADSRIGLALAVIHKELTNRKLSISRLAKDVCMSESKFFRKFKQTLGITPSDYINAKRVEFAKGLIKTKVHLSIADIAYLSGYNNGSYFVRKFKCYVQCSPTAYKKKMMG